MLDIRKLSRHFAALYIILISGLASQNLCAEECRDILEQGVRNTYQSLKTGNLRSAFTDGFCNSSLQTVKNNSGGGLNIGFPVDGIPVELGGSYNESSGNDFRQQVCANRTGDLNDSKYESLLQAVADPQIVDAWSRCKSNEGGVLLNGKLNGSTLILSMRFRNIGSVHETVLVGDASFDGITCPNNWVNGLKVDGSTRYMQCKRIGNDPVTVTVNTTFDGALFFIPSAPQLSISSGPTVGAGRSPPAPAPAVMAKICVHPSNSNNRCPAANPGAPDGSQCSCQPPTSFTAFTNGVIRSEEIKGVIPAQQGVIPAPQ